MWTCFRSVDRLTLPLWRRRAWKCATVTFLCWVPIVRGLIWLVTRRCKLSTDGCGSRGPSDFPETGADRRTVSCDDRSVSGIRELSEEVSYSTQNPRADVPGSVRAAHSSSDRLEREREHFGFRRGQRRYYWKTGKRKVRLSRAPFPVYWTHWQLPATHT